MMEIKTTTMALDVGERRVGVALASVEAQLASPLVTLERGDSFWEELSNLITMHRVNQFVVGYPRSMSGETTTQTATIELFAKELQKKYNLPTAFQDETLTSVKAKEELELRGKPYEKSEVDALAATYILTDYLASIPRKSV